MKQITLCIPLLLIQYAYNKLIYHFKPTLKTWDSIYICSIVSKMNS